MPLAEDVLERLRAARQYISDHPEDHDMSNWWTAWEDGQRVPSCVAGVLAFLADGALPENHAEIRERAATLLSVTEGRSWEVDLFYVNQWPEPYFTAWEHAERVGDLVARAAATQDLLQEIIDRGEFWWTRPQVTA